MSDENRTITLTIGGTDITFEPTIVAYNQLQNDAATGRNLAGTMRDYLLKVVSPASRDALLALLVRPGATAQIATVLNGEYAPELEIEVKR